MSNLVKGTMILTVATALSKILGFIYIIPFTLLVGTQGYILFQYAYQPYVIILSIATMGVPLAVSKFVSKHNELGDYTAGLRLFKLGLIFLTITGLVCCLFLYFSAPSIASILIDDNDQTGNNATDIIYVIRMVSFALIIVPPMAVARGFFQGYQDMKPTAYSQVIEQLIRIVFILLGSFLAIYMFHQPPSTAVGIATFAACIGAIAGSLVLYHYWMKKRIQLISLTKSSTHKPYSGGTPLLKEVFSYAIPFVIIGLAIPLYQTIDTFTINQALMAAGQSQGSAESVNSIVSLVQKIILIPVSLATAFGLTLVPGITASFTSNNKKELKYQIRKTYQVILYLTLPCVVGLMVLAPPVFRSFFPGVKNPHVGEILMAWHAPTALLFSFFIVTAAILQGLDRHGIAMFSLLSGLILKISLNIPFLMEFGGGGSILSTNIGFLLSLVINGWAIRKYARFSFRTLIPMTFQIGWQNVLIGGAAFLTARLLTYFFQEHYVLYVAQLALGAFVGGILYFILGIKSSVLQSVLGDKITTKLFASIRRLTRKRT